MRRRVAFHGLPFGPSHIYLFAPALALALSLSLAAGGCGLYSFSSSSLPPYMKTVAVPVFENATLEPDVANQVTEAVTQRFLSDSRLKLVGESRADVVVHGSVTSYDNRVHNYQGDVPLDYIVVLNVRATLRDQAKSRDLWKDETFTVSAVYAPSGAGGEALSTEAQARAKAIGELAEDILARAMEQW
ncbi:MAG: LptE family protein [Candidatus Eisenbacteria bacterium]|nr:LptE family protein [Candidatus Eisenbacteria bacterium]